MAIPNKLPEWDKTEVNTVEADTQHKDEGWLAPAGVPEKPPFQTFNWWQNLVYQWILRFKNVTGGLNNVTELLSFPETVDGTSINVRGYTTSNDGGGGLFNWDSTIDKSTANGGTIIDPDQTLLNQGNGIGNGCWVKQFEGIVNALCFGVSVSRTDNEIPLKNALLSERNVYVPKGEYVFASRMVIDGEANISLSGERGSILKTTLTDKTMGLLAYNNCSKCKLVGLSLVGSREGLTTEVGATPLMHIVESDNILIKEVFASFSTYTCFGVGGGDSVTFERCLIDEIGDVGIHLFNFPTGFSPTNMKVLGNTVKNTWGSAVIDNGINTIVSDNHFDTNGTGFGQGIGGVDTLGAAGIYTVITNESKSIYSNNTCLNATGLGFDISDGRGSFIIDGNYIEGARLSGIAVASPRVVISNNICVGNGIGAGTPGEVRYAGIEIIARNTEIEDIMISGNICKGNEYGIQLQGHSTTTETLNYVQILGNNLNGNTNIGINVINRDRMRAISAQNNFKSFPSTKKLGLSSTQVLTQSIENAIVWDVDNSYYESAFDPLNPTRLIINKFILREINVRAELYLSVTASNTYIKAFIKRNGIAGEFALTTETIASGQTRVSLNLELLRANVTDGDYFEVIVIPYGADATSLSGLSVSFIADEH